MMELSLQEKERLVKEKVKKLKGFYTHAIIYLVINSLLFLIKIIGTSIYGEHFMGPIWHFSTLMAPLFWGIGLGFHWVALFGFGAKWEERQMQKYISKQK